MHQWMNDWMNDHMVCSVSHWVCNPTILSSHLLRRLCVTTGNDCREVVQLFMLKIQLSFPCIEHQNNNRFESHSKQILTSIQRWDQMGKKSAKQHRLISQNRFQDWNCNTVIAANLYSTTFVIVIVNFKFLNLSAVYQLIPERCVNSEGLTRSQRG